MFDAVHVVVSAVRELNRSQEIGVKPLACTSANIWPHGTSLMNYLRMVSQSEGHGGSWEQQPPQAGALTVSTLPLLCLLPMLTVLCPVWPCHCPCVDCVLYGSGSVLSLTPLLHFSLCLSLLLPHPCLAFLPISGPRFPSLCPASRPAR